jgi:Flp pilus assembly protein TadG
MKGSTHRGQRGQALAEMGIVVVLFVTLCVGILEFGRAWIIVNMITHATRDGARVAAVALPSNRDSYGMITNKSSIQSQVLSEIQTVTPTTGFAVNVTQSTVGGVPMVQVQVTGTVPYMFKLVGDSFAVNRTVTFRDEGRASS